MGTRADSDINSAVRLLSVMAHELRLPLSHIKGFVSTLRRPDMEWDEATRGEFLAQIERETDRLTQLVDELLKHSNPPNRRVRPRRLACEPQALVAGGVDRVRGLLGGRSLDVDVPADLPVVEVDGPAIERVIANLLQNALKYTPPETRIRLAAQAEDSCLVLRVEDDGPGISMRDRAQIFRGFFRSPGARDSGQGGSGLGLAICLSIVSAHGGRIWADARPGGGARFTIALPLSRMPPLAVSRWTSPPLRRIRAARTNPARAARTANDPGRSAHRAWRAQGTSAPVDRAWLERNRSSVQWPHGVAPTHRRYPARSP